MSAHLPIPPCQHGNCNLSNSTVYVEAAKTLVLNGDDFKEGNEVCDTGIVEAVAWSFCAGIAGVSETSLQTSISKLNQAARAQVYQQTSLRVFMHYIGILIQLLC